MKIISVEFKLSYINFNKFRLVHIYGKCARYKCKFCELGYSGFIDDDNFEKKRKISTKIFNNRDIVNHVIDKKYFCIGLPIVDDKYKNIEYVCKVHPNKINTIRYTHLNNPSRFKECIFCKVDYNGSYEPHPLLKNSNLTNTEFMTFINGHQNIIVTGIVRKKATSHFVINCKCITHNKEFVSDTSHIGKIRQCYKCHDRLIYSKQHINQLYEEKNVSVYLKIITIDDFKYIKIGITKNETGKRQFRTITKSQVYLVSYITTNLKDAILLEHDILEKFKKHKAVFASVFDGHTEYLNFSPKLLDDVQKYFIVPS